MGAQLVYLVSGQNTVITSISGNNVIANVSGNPVVANISGGITASRVPTIFRTRNILVCSAASGGAALLSGDVINATLVNTGLSGMHVWLGSTTDPPFSGKGLYLPVGSSVKINIDNFSKLQACSVISGAQLSYAGEQY